MKCPKCGHTFKAENQAKGGKARWRGMSKTQRKQAASDAAKARWAKRPNRQISLPRSSSPGVYLFCVTASNTAARLDSLADGK